MAIANTCRTIHQGGFTWTLRADAPPELVRRLIAVRDGTESAPAVKRNPKRAVFRLDIGPRRFYAKQHFFRSVPDALWAALRGTRAEREWRNLRSLSEHGLPAVKPMALGVRRRFGVPTESWLVTEETSGRSLKEVAETALRENGKEARGDIRAIVRAVASGLRELHERGFDCPDLHMENVIISRGGQPVLLDVHAARQRGAPLPKRRRVQNLAFLCNSVPAGADLDAVAVRFVRTYLGRSSSRGELVEMLEHIRSAVGRLRLRHIRSRSRRCFRRGSEFTFGRTRIGRVYRRRDVSEQEIRRAIELHHAVLRGAASGTVLKRGPKGNVTLLSPEAFSDRGRLCVKEFVRAGALWLLAPARLRHRNAVRFWAASLGLRVRGVPAPEALATVLGRGGHSYVLMRAVESAEGLPEYVARRLGPNTPSGRRRAFIAEGADALARLFEAGVLHRDLKGTNVLVREKGEGWEFVLLDLEAVRFPCRVRAGYRILNLAQLNSAVPLALTRADRLRFLRRLATRDPALWTRRAMRRIVQMTLRRRCVWA